MELGPLVTKSKGQHVPYQKALTLITTTASIAVMNDNSWQILKKKQKIHIRHIESLVPPIPHTKDTNNITDASQSDENQLFVYTAVSVPSWDALFMWKGQ